MLHDKINAAFTRFEQMQKNHSQLVEEEKNLDFKKFDFTNFVFERNHAFEELKNALNECFRWIKNSKEKQAPELVACCRKRLEIALKQERQLLQKMAPFRVAMAGVIKNMQQGKKALTGYGHSCSTSSPKYVSRKG